MQVSRAGISDLTTRLDPQYYGPENLRDDRLIEGWRPQALDDLRHEESRISYGVLKPEHCESREFRMARIQDFSDPFLDVDRCTGISPEQFQGYPRSECKEGDLLIAIAGYVGRAAIVPKLDCRLNINQHIARFRPDGKDRVDDRFLVSYLTSSIGRRQIQRQVTGSVQAGINLEDLRLLSIPLPAYEAQAYIGNKIRQAERLRASAVSILESVDAELNSAMPDRDRVPRLFSRVGADALTERLDVRPYRSHYLAAIEALCSVPHEPLAQIADLSSGDPVPSAEFADVGVPLVRIRDIGREGFVDQDVHVSPDYTSNRPGALARESLIVLGMDGEFRTQFFLEEDLPQFVNQRVAILEAHSIRPELLTFWLNRPEGQLQLDRLAVKTTVEHTSLQNVGKVLIPRLASRDEERLSDGILFARRSAMFARRLTIAAMVLVEALIEGKVAEDELKAANAAAADGDSDLDRRLISRVSPDGLDRGGARLIPDVDALTDALNEASRLAENGSG